MVQGEGFRVQGLGFGGGEGFKGLRFGTHPKPTPGFVFRTFCSQGDMVKTLEGAII